MGLVLIGEIKARSRREAKLKQLGEQRGCKKAHKGASSAPDESLRSGSVEVKVWLAAPDRATKHRKFRVLDIGYYYGIPWYTMV